MASNGYMRKQCHRCIFHLYDSDIGDLCILRNEDLYSTDHMRWVSSTMYIRDPHIRTKYNENCEHFVNINEIRDTLRKEFGLETAIVE